MIQIRLDGESDLPPFEQVRSQIADAIGDGTLPEGFRLPTVRQLAGDLGIAANTVARSYRELESADLIETRGRLGSFVAATASPQRDLAVQAARAYIRRAGELGFAPTETLAIVRRELEQVSAATGQS